MTNKVNIQNNEVEESTTTKYMIHAEFTIDGVVEKPDVVGALFGQTEGLLSDDLDLRDLQKSGRVGRIQVNLSIKGGKTRGVLMVPSSLDKVETSILAAAIETVDRIGPCNAEISIKKIEDVREEKRKKIIERATDLLKKWDSQASQESTEIHEEVVKAARVGGVIQYSNLPAGPEINSSDTIIVVEGRADITACLRAGVRNTIAVEGTQVPRVVSDLTKSKTTIAFLDGDRGGDLILKELLMYGYIDFVARAPIDKEVEDLHPKEIIEQLSKKVPIEHASFISEIHASDILEKAIKKKQSKFVGQAPIQKDIPEPQRRTPDPQYQQQSGRPIRGSSRGGNTRQTSRRTPPTSREQSDRRGPRTHQRKQPVKKVIQIPEELMTFVKDIDGKEKQEGIFLDDKLKEIKRVPVDQLYDEIKKAKKSVSKIIFDGIITQRLIEACNENDIYTIVGARVAEITSRPEKVHYYTFA